MASGAKLDEGFDPRDPKAVQALLDRGLDDPKGWVAAGR